MTEITEAPAAIPPPPPASGSSPVPAARRPRHRLRLLLVFAVLIGAVVFLLVEGLGSSLDYFDTLDQALAHKAAIGTTTIRLEGTVVPGSIRRTGTGTDFTMSDGNGSDGNGSDGNGSDGKGSDGKGSDGKGRTVVVHNTGSPPELFQTGIPVVVDGHFASASSTLFLSDQIEVKHSATYIAAHPTRVKGHHEKTVH